MTEATRAGYRLEGELLEVCDCNVLCPCWIGEDSDNGSCESALAYHFSSGMIAGVDVSGLTLAVAAFIPGNVLKGNMRVILYVDDRATDAQYDAIVRVWSGELGGPIVELIQLYGVLAFAAGWAVMTAAMMLPTAAPLTLLFARLVRRRPDRRWLVALLLLGYLVVWLLFGMAARAGYGMLDALAVAFWVSPPDWSISAALLGLAGLYQFSPLKERCLDACRSPMQLIAAHWTGRDHWRQALLLGAHHGLFCVGCCWALMLLMFAVGAGSLG
ncbi:MAG: hypothetical protein OHK0022_03710 [Roseiflexaceae bacterium]